MSESVTASMGVGKNSQGYLWEQVRVNKNKQTYVLIKFLTLKGSIGVLVADNRILDESLLCCGGSNHYSLCLRLQSLCLHRKTCYGLSLQRN